jgi:hypothetical protein
MQSESGRATIWDLLHTTYPPQNYTQNMAPRGVVLPIPEHGTGNQRNYSGTVHYT